ncbi:allantoinase [Anaerobacillus alkalidiazotrophicus]|uniref:Allantoinase n=1 Tax=Anaerobacillus alkalidiazotrophicus TaxID=472963 RepID=A0A1S2M0J1_9BACI|nr:allantoinase AllB [Anaerobacillus alkalidiazotrophicus]OIJ18074.1 allantoinase [Anaerobacillus alkalidiazotrophicus]OIJ19553.1 allantoinase [Anaerobacillus alkalidiazotrophicus]
MQLVIKNGKVFIDQTFKNVDVFVKDGLIEKILPIEQQELENGITVVDANGCYVFPGFIDSHVHFNDPGREEWEGFETGSEAAAVGGMTTIFDMPLNSSPSVVNTKILDEKKKHLQTRSTIDFGLWAGITADNVRNKEELKLMRDNGIVGFKAFLSESGISDFACLSKEQLKEAMLISKKLGTVLALHAEENEQIQMYTTALIENNRVDRQAFLESRPLKAEFAAIKHALSLIEQTKASVHFVHVSSSEAIELIFQYKEQGYDVTVEVCPHYLLFSDQDFLQKGPILKCAPPLRDLETIEKLWGCIEKGWVDTIGSDHSPCLYSMKEVGEENIWKAWGGIQGVQFAFPFFIGEATRRGIPLETILPMMTENVGKRFGLRNKGTIKVGYDADLTIFKPNEKYIVTKSDILFRNKYSPYENVETIGKVVITIVRGNIVHDEKRELKPPNIGLEISYI